MKLSDVEYQGDGKKATFFYTADERVDFRELIKKLADEFKVDTFTFRALLGLALTLVFVTRGFAAAVWTHLVYDVWVLVLDG